MKKTVLALITATLLAGCATAPTTTEYVNVGPVWSQLYNLPAGKDVAVKVETDKPEYAVGERMQFTATAKADGKLWLVTVSPDDEVSLLFPNQLSPNNAVEAGTPLVIPALNSQYDLKAAEPVGKNVVLALVTTGNMGRDQVLEILRGKNQQQVSKAIAIEQRSPRWGSAKSVITVTPAR